MASPSPNPEELKAITELRKRFKDDLSKEYLEDDMFLIRWVRAREMDLDKAETMLKNWIQWRKNNKVDDILERKIDSYFPENYPRWTDGLDKEGRPVYTGAIGKWDVRKVVNANRSPEFLNYTTEGYEQLLAVIKETNRRWKETPAGEGQPQRVDQLIAIFDFDEFAWSQLFNFRAVQNFLSLGSIYEAYYPEYLYACFFINSPSLISKALMLLKPILAPKTYAKIRVLGTNREEWQAELLKLIDADQLRPQFGGTMGLISSQDSQEQED